MLSVCSFWYIKPLINAGKPSSSKVWVLRPINYYFLSELYLLLSFMNQRSQLLFLWNLIILSVFICVTICRKWLNYSILWLIVSIKFCFDKLRIPLSFSSGSWFNFLRIYISSFLFCIYERNIKAFIHIRIIYLLM